MFGKYTTSWVTIFQRKIFNHCDKLQNEIYSLSISITKKQTSSTCHLRYNTIDHREKFFPHLIDMKNCFEFSTMYKLTSILSELPFANLQTSAEH